MLLNSNTNTHERTSMVQFICILINLPLMYKQVRSFVFDHSLIVHVYLCLSHNPNLTNSCSFGMFVRKCSLNLDKTLWCISHVCNHIIVTKLHHNKARLHIVQHVQDFLTLHDVQVIYHTPYSPGLEPCEFFLFPKGKRDLKGRRFECPQMVLGAAKTVFEYLM